MVNEKEKLDAVILDAVMRAWEEIVNDKVDDEAAYYYWNGYAHGLMKAKEVLK